MSRPCWQFKTNRSRNKKNGPIRRKRCRLAVTRATGGDPQHTKTSHAGWTGADAVERGELPHLGWKAFILNAADCRREPITVANPAQKMGRAAPGTDDAAYHFA